MRTPVWNTRTWNKAALIKSQNLKSLRRNIRSWNQISSAQNKKAKELEKKKLNLPINFYIWGLLELIRCWKFQKWKMNMDRSRNWKPNYYSIIQSWQLEFNNWMSKTEISWWQTKILKTTLAEHKLYWMKPKVTCKHRICWVHSYPSSYLTPNWNSKIMKLFLIERSMSWSWASPF